MKMESSELLKVYEKALANAQMGLWSYDFETRVIEWDDGFRKLYDIPEGSYSSPIEQWLIRVPQEDQEQIAIDFKKIMSGDSLAFVTFRYECSSGEFKHIRCRCFKNSDLENKKSALIGIHWDVTELKIMQDELVEQSKFVLLGDIYADLAHEINNPLLIIQGKSMILQKKASGDKIDIGSIKGDLESIQTNCERIDKIMRSFTGLTAITQAQSFQAVSILKVVDKVFSNCSDRFKNKKLRLSLHADESINYDHMIHAKFSELVSAINHLVNNAYEAVSTQSDGWVRIGITLINDKYRIEVVDSGKEIPDEVAKKMMDPFFTTKQNGKGAGLGLSVVKNIIKNHLGSVRYERKNGHTHFVVTLPRV